ncbi:UNVERIFIED_CONTAM: hypothetical protein Sradi_3720000 [Sesamum radiatum]|uniref:SWIM-type domain-containing protein n=1 Tax=Sesamum radiatum TaxID=300843 RepID=A0AAW2PXZ1_SESRA
MENEQGNHENIDKEVGDDDSGDNDLVQSEDDFASDKGSEGEEETKFPLFNEVDAYSPKIQLGMIFASKKEFRTVIQSHAITTRRNLKITKNDKRRIYAKCAVDECDWKCHALKTKNEQTFQIGEYNPNHKCGVSYNVKNVKSSWSSGKYESSFRTDPKRNVKGFRNDVIRDIRVHVSKFQAFRAKHAALKAIEGKSEDQYAKLWDYAAEIRRTNPGSTVAGCRPLIGVDGCHLKGPHDGVLLAAVGIDPNNNAFPIAYAVVGRESRESWEWFLMLLRTDLGIERDYEYTFMSDKQKGLIPAFESIFPCCDNRFCVRHLHGNMKRAGFKGVAHKKLFWKAAMSTTLADFEKSMKELGTVDKNALEWLSDKSPVHLSRSHFNPYPKCDILLNNLRYIVDLGQHTCSCRKWDVSGIPCQHAMSAICNQVKDPKDYVHKYYWVDTYLKVYENVIYPINGPSLWKETGFLPSNEGRAPGRPARARRLEPDEQVRKQKKRKRGAKGQQSEHRLGRQQMTIKCSQCGEQGHNKKACKRQCDATNETGQVHNSGQDQLHDHILQESFVEEFGQSQDGGNEVRKKTQSLSTQGFRMPRRATSQPLNPTLYPPRPLVTATTGVCTRAASLHPGPGRVNIRPPVPFARGHPPVAISIMTKERAKMAAEHGFPVLKKDGKKFVTLSNLSAAVKASTSKDKGKKKA